MNQDILIRNGFISVPQVDQVLPVDWVSAYMATIVSNLAHYGYALDQTAFASLYDQKSDVLIDWWKEVKPVLDEISGKNKDIGRYIVYKNFPREVLDLDHATSILNQFLIYYGMPYDFVREVEESRLPLDEMTKLKVLTRSKSNTFEHIFAQLQNATNRWSDNQKDWAARLVGSRNCIGFSDFAFKENAICLAGLTFEAKEFSASSATDILRLCAVLSGGDVSLRERTTFRHFKRAERRRILAELNKQTNLLADVSERKEQWKRLFERLRPGDYAFESVKAAYDELYKKQVKAFASFVDPQIPSKDAFRYLVQRPGEFLRRFHHYYSMFPEETLDKFTTIISQLTNRQLVGLRAYLQTVNHRKTFIYAPKSNWSKAQILPNSKKPIREKDIAYIDQMIGTLLSERLNSRFNEGFTLDPRCADVKLQTNDQRLAEYGRGTSFSIPPNITFFRSASYWQSEHSSIVWYDNGWNFFNDEWKPIGTVGWDAQHFPANCSNSNDYAAVFSGDPVNISNGQGKACQMADLYLDKLVKNKIRYAVWNILCFSKKKFSESTEVLALLQMGENPETGKTFEPSRAQMIFPLKSDNYSSYVAYLDLVERKLVYMDVALPANVMNTQSNAKNLQKLMPAYREYLDGLPSVFDLAKDGHSGTIPVLYSDDQSEISGGKAFVFKPEKPSNRFDRLTISDLLED